MRLWLLVTTVAALVTAVGCVTVAPVTSGGSMELGPGDGILVLHISTNVPLERLAFGTGSIRNVPEGEHIELYVTKAGSYRWSEIRPVGREQPRFRVRRDDDWRFRVRAGRMNYVGMLDIDRSGWLHLNGRIRDRSALAAEELRDRYSELLERYPMVYSGPGHNVFFDHYQKAKLAAGRQDASPPESTDTEVTGP